MTIVRHELRQGMAVLGVWAAAIGTGLAAVMYFLNLIANMTDRARLLKYLTPFAYCEGADILAAGRLDAGLLAVGALYAVAGVGAAYGRYRGKDIL